MDINSKSAPSNTSEGYSIGKNIPFEGDGRYG